MVAISGRSPPSFGRRDSASRCSHSRRLASVSATLLPSPSFLSPPLSLCRPRTAVRCRATLPGRDLSECACFSRLESANKLPRLRPDNPAGVERNDKGLISEMVRRAMIGRYRAVRRGGGGRSVGACRVRPGFVSFRVILFRNALMREFCNGKSKSFRIHVVCMLV